MMELFEASRRLCGGGIGGDREVQPGDELLLLLSATRQKRIVQFATAPSDFNNVLPYNAFLECISWMKLLLNSMDASPHSYTFKLEMLESCRILGLAEPAVVAFNALGARFVQVIKKNIHNKLVVKK